MKRKWMSIFKAIHDISSGRQQFLLSHYVAHLRGKKAAVKGLDMSVEIAAVIECFLADSALEWPDPGVNPRVDDKILPAAEEFAANAAHLTHSKKNRFKHMD
jgi:hypothetical protein